MRSRQLLSPEQLTEALTYTKLLPGSTVVQVVAYLGHRLRGWAGSAVATTMFLLPSAALMLVLAAVYARGVAIPTVSRALHGVTVAVVGILAATTYRLGETSARSAAAAVVTTAAFVCGAVFGTNAAFIVIAAGVLGLIVPAQLMRPSKPAAKLSEPSTAEPRAKPVPETVAETPPTPLSSSNEGER